MSMHHDRTSGEKPYYILYSKPGNLRFGIMVVNHIIQEIKRNIGQRKNNYLFIQKY